MTGGNAPDSAAFGGAKLAVLQQGLVLTLQRDEADDIPYPGLWDLPGGGREGGETPLACALRETREELALIVSPEEICWRKSYPGTEGEGPLTWFFVARLDGLSGRHISLGDEGQRWTWMELRHFLARRDAVPQLQQRLREYVAITGPVREESP